MSHTKDQYFYATVYNKEYEMYGFSQHNLTNEQYCEWFDNKFDVVEAIGIIRKNRVLIEDTAQEFFRV